jgi:hypothetical protein
MGLRQKWTLISCSGKTVGGKDAGAEAKGTKGCFLIVFSGCKE